jgi:hypothetical protein
MSFYKQLAKKKTTLINKWFEAVIATYPRETEKFLRSQKDPFNNPVGQATLQGLHALFDLVCEKNPDMAKAEDAIDPIVRIRAIQDFTPSRATGFVFDLKGIIRDVIPTADTDHRTRVDLDVLDRRIDQLGLLAFDIYMKCREKIYELKANEMKNRTYKAFARAGLVKEPLDDPNTPNISD